MYSRKQGRRSRRWRRPSTARNQTCGSELCYLCSVIFEEAVQNCYQCGKCTAGCPQADRMDLVPNQVLRLVQIGETEKAARANSIWQCVSCLTCSSRCPKEVDCAGVLDALRQFSVEHSITAPAAQRTVIFQQAFLQSIRRNGRLNELELTGLFKTRSFLADTNLPFLLKDAALAPRLLRRKKLHVTGESVEDRDLVRRIFERCNG
jgi:heterodisulfide reductase subunit C2